MEEKYTITYSGSMDDKSIMETIERAKEGLPSFPEGHELAGVIDYTNAKEAPTLSAFVKYKDELLLLQRSSKINNPDTWAPVLGYLDEKIPAYQKIEEELTEELLGLIGEDSTRQGLIKTPKRVAESWKFLCQGYHQNLNEDHQ